MSIVSSYSGEVMLLSWKESSTQGRTVTFLLNEDEDIHPFKDLATKSGKRAGQRFMAAFVAISDDEQPQDEENPVRDAGILCRDQDFWGWVNERSFIAVSSEQEAKQWLCEQLSIKSRAELSTNPVAATRFKVIAAQFRQSLSLFKGK